MRKIFTSIFLSSALALSSVSLGYADEPQPPIDYEAQATAESFKASATKPASPQNPSSSVVQDTSNGGTPQPATSSATATSANPGYSVPEIQQSYTDGTVRDQRGCITANYTPDGGGIMTERLVNNRGQQIALCSKAAPEAPATPVDEEDNGPSEDQLIAQPAIRARGGTLQQDRKSVV